MNKHLDHQTHREVHASRRKSLVLGWILYLIAAGALGYMGWAAWQ